MYSMSIKLLFTLSEETDEPQPPWKEKLITFLKFLWAFIDSLMVSITNTLNKFSRDYRYVMRTLSVEKKQLKVCIFSLWTFYSFSFINALKHYISYTLESR